SWPGPCSRPTSTGSSSWTGGTGPSASCPARTSWRPSPMPATGPEGEQDARTQLPTLPGPTCVPSAQPYHARCAMKNMLTTELCVGLALRAETAADLMTPDPVSIGADATIKEAVAFLTDKGFSAAPVIDRAGRPVGVLSRSDVLVHDRETVE